MSSSIPLTSAVTSGDEKAVSELLANGADVNERTSGGQTAVILAVIFGHTNIVRLLVNAGADPHERDNLGLNAIDWAQRRGSTEALDILTNAARASTPPKRILINFEEPEQSKHEVAPPAHNVETRESVSEAEKSRRWVTGLKQRLDEQAQRRLNRDEPPPQPDPTVPEPEPVEVKLTEPPEPVRAHSSRILMAPAVVETGKRKRCPKCNAIYNGDLVSYCSYDVVPLVDIDEPIISEPPPPKSNPPLFWIMVIITLAGSILIGSLITAYLYKSNQASARTAAEHRTVQKGLPQLSGDLVGKAVSLPEAECPVRGREAVSGTVTVYIIVAKNGQVYKARGLGGDWLMRGCATEAAMKSTFEPEKLIDRETEGTITYTFQP